MPKPKPFTPWSIASALILVVLAANTWWSPLADPDLWWLMWAGESLSSGAGLPLLNTLSFTAPESPWTCHEPLVAWLYGVLGLDGVYLGRMACHALTVVLIARILSPVRSGWACVLALLWLLPLASFSFSERALAWGNLALCAFLVLLPLRGSGAAIARLAAIALWANIHGSFVLGLLLVLVHRPKEFPLAALATLVNPHGIGLHSLIVGYGIGQGPQGLVHEFVEEWRPLLPTSGEQALRLGCLCIGFWACWRTKKWRPILMCALVSGLAIKHWRYCTPAGLILLPYVARALDQKLPKRPAGSLYWPLAPILFLTGLAAPRVAQDKTLFPPALAAAIPPDARTWSDFTLGGWLGYLGHRVFWDSRNDCYPSAVVEDGLRIAYQIDGWESALGRWNIDHVVTGQDELAEALRAMGWLPVMETEKLLLLARPQDSG